MPFPEEEINALKHEQELLKKRVARLEEKHSSQPVQENIVEHKEAVQQKNSTTGIILIIIGGLLTLTMIGAIIGIPLLIWGIIINSKQLSTTTKSVVHKTTHQGTHTQQPPPAKEPKSQFEERMGVKWLGIIGIAALVIGIAFFIFSEGNGISYSLRIILGSLLGLVLIFGGKFVSRNKQLEVWSKILIGGGFAMTYFSVYAAYYVQEYQEAIGIPQTMDIILLLMIAVGAIIVSLKENSRIIAAEAFLLGYLTSFMATNLDVMTLISALVLSIGVIVVYSIKQWGEIGIGGLVATYGLYSFWSGQHSNEFYLGTFFLTTYFLAYSIQAYLQRGKAPDVHGRNLTTVLFNSLFYYVFMLLQIRANYPNFDGWFSLLLAVVHFIMYLFAYKRAFANTLLYLAIFYATISVPMFLAKEVVTLIFLAEAFIFTLVGIQKNVPALRTSGIIISVVSTIKLLVIDMYRFRPTAETMILESSRFWSFLVAIIIFYGLYAYLYHHKKLLTPTEKEITPLYSWTATALLVILSVLEVHEWTAWLTLLWVFFATSLLVLAWQRKNKDLYSQGLVLSLILYLKVLLIDSWSLGSIASNGFFDSRVFAIIPVIVYSYWASTFVRKNNLQISNGLSWIGSFFAALLILIEFDGAAVSGGWAGLGLAVLLLGFVLQRKQLRLQGITLLAIAIIKVFLYDTQSLEPVYRTISYIVLGIILITASFMYAKYKEKLNKVVQ